MLTDGAGYLRATRRKMTLYPHMRGVVVRAASLIAVVVFGGCNQLLGVTEGTLATGGASSIGGNNPVGGASTGGARTGGAAGIGGNNSIGGASAGGVPNGAGGSISSGGSPQGGASGLGGAAAMGGSGGSTEPVIVYSNMADPDNWTTFDLRTVPALGPGPRFAGGVFDGRYIILPPYPDGITARYDTTQAFAASSSWSGFDILKNFAYGRGFVGAALAQGKVFFAPFENPGIGYGGPVLRFDSQADFTAKESWSAFLTRLEPAPLASFGFQGVASNGRYVYFAPYYNEVLTWHGVAVRYDTQGEYADNASWRAFDTATLSPGAKGFRGALSAGGYTYLIPHYSTALSGVVVRVQESEPFDAATSWGSFDLTALNAGAVGFIGAVFDGRYLYLVPYASSFVARYDTQAAFDAGTSWQIFDANQVSAAARSFVGGAFDGRYVYLVPGSKTSGLVVRYDTTKNFDDPLGSWESFDVSLANQDAKGFFGAVFDGEFIYLVPIYNSVVSRFKARTKSPLPDFYRGGSFF